MTNIALIRSNKVINIIPKASDPEFNYGILATGPVDIIIELSNNDRISIGDLYEDGIFTPSPIMPIINTEPIRVSKADFQRLFQAQERYALNALRKEVAAIPAEAYSTTNPLLLAAEDVLFAFEQPAEFIELNHPETYQGLMLLSYLGILTEARVNEIVTS